MSRRLLMVDDDVLFVSAVKDALERDDIEVVGAHSLAEGRRRIAAEAFALALLDNRLPDGDGLSLVDELAHANEDVQILLCTAHPTLDNAVAALRRGIQDYVSKPVALEELRLSVLRTARAIDLQRTVRVQRRRSEQERSELVGSSAAMNEVRHLVGRASELRSPVLLTGETGTGKSLLAKVIHDGSERDGERPFVAVNCAALPESLIESELFGSEKGAFTGANSARPGLFELADGGTLFLDEIGELSPPLQAKLLTALDDGAIRRVGGSRARKVDVRVTAATNLDVDVAIRDGRLREDLYYRLSVLHIRVPPLRARTSDLADLVPFFLERLAPGRKLRRAHEVIALAEGELARMSTYDWPGNTRELRNVLERSMVLHPSAALRPSELLREAAPVRPRPARAKESVQTLAEVEKEHVLAMLERCGGNRAQTAQLLEIGVATLRRKLNEWGS